MKYEIDAQLLKSLLSDLTLYTRNGKQFVKRKSRVSSDRLKNGPEYRLFRQHQQDFKLAASSGKLLRNAFAPLLKGVTDSKYISRLTAQVLKVVKSATKNSSGQRNILYGDLNLLRDFEFNAHCALSQVLNAPFQITTDAAMSELYLELPTLIPTKQVLAPRGASHFCILMGIAAIDFASGIYQTNFTKTGQIPLTSNSCRTMNLNCQLDEQARHPVFVVLGIQFSQQVRNDYKVIHEPEFDALSVVAVEHFVV